jgi:hypothetical protein
MKQNTHGREVGRINSRSRDNRAAFTLIQIMFVVAILGSFAAFARPGHAKARTQSEGRHTVNDAHRLVAVRAAGICGTPLGLPIGAPARSEYAKQRAVPAASNV